MPPCRGRGRPAGLGEAVEQRLAVAAEAERAVDDDGAGPLQGGGQQVQAPLEHHRDMSGLVAQGALSGRARRVTHHWVPARSEKGGPPAPKASADREREEAEPYVRAAHAGDHFNPAGSLGLPLRVTLVHGVARSINRPARRGTLPGKPQFHRNHPYGHTHTTRVGYLTTTLD